ncbi:MAG TPA: hypothetical protein PLB31_04000 [Fimbriimonadaceae bacterium]|nr:hypothetical protein [Fimbriimonadaceae bacterium]
MPRSFTLGGSPWSTKAEWRAALAPAEIQLNANAESWLSHPDFPFGAVPPGELLILTASELGLPQGGTRAELEAAAQTQGLEPCPAMAALALRLAWADQPEGRLAREHRAPDGSVTIMSLPFLPEPPSDPEDDYGFYLIRAEGQLWLRGYVAPADHIWAPHDVLAWSKVSSH